MAYQNMNPNLFDPIFLSQQSHFGAGFISPHNTDLITVIIVIYVFC